MSKFTLQIQEFICFSFAIVKLLNDHSCAHFDAGVYFTWHRRNNFCIISHQILPLSSKKKHGKHFIGLFGTEKLNDILVWLSSSQNIPSKLLKSHIW